MKSSDKLALTPQVCMEVLFSRLPTQDVWEATPGFTILCWLHRHRLQRSRSPMNVFSAPSTWDRKQNRLVSLAFPYVVIQEYLFGAKWIS